MARAKDLAIITGVTLASTLLLWAVTGLNTVRQNFDGPYYAVVAKSWYKHDIISSNFSFPLPLEYYPAHFPLYPFLMSLFGKTGYLNGGLIINLTASVAVALTLYYIASKQKWGNPLYVSLASLFFWPRMWAVRSIASPETLFILFIISSLYFFETKRYWLAGLVGTLAVLTKSPGILLFPAFVMASKFNRKIWPTLLIPVSLILLFMFFKVQTGDFWAYFHTGDNIHLQILPFKVFDSRQSWVGDFWLEDILWVYLIAGIGVWRAFKVGAGLPAARLPAGQGRQVWAYFGLIYFVSILFVSHRDISRYSLPLVPIVLLGFAEVFEKKEVRWAVALLTIPMFFYTVNFLTHNTVVISNWAPFFAR